MYLLAGTIFSPQPALCDQSALCDQPAQQRFTRPTRVHICRIHKVPTRIHIRPQYRLGGLVRRTPALMPERHLPKHSGLTTKPDRPSVRSDFRLMCTLSDRSSDRLGRDQLRMLDRPPDRRQPKAGDVDIAERRQQERPVQPEVIR